MDHRKCPTLGPNRKDGQTRKRNQHPIPCWTCGQTIPPGEAYLERRGATNSYVGVPVVGVDLAEWTSQP